MRMRWVAVSAVMLAGALAGCQREAAKAPEVAASGAAGPTVAVPKGPEKLVVALGDSLFAGYGLSPGQAYPARLEAALRGRGINARVVNAGVSGDTTADGLARLDFTLNSLGGKPDLVLISLGGNDMLRGLAPGQARANLETILARLGERGIPAVLMGMLAPPNMGADYVRDFNAIYPELAKRHKAGLVPFFVDAVIREPALQQADHKHPTAAGVEAIVGATGDTVAGALAG